MPTIETLRQEATELYFARRSGCADPATREVLALDLVIFEAKVARADTTPAIRARLIAEAKR